MKTIRTIAMVLSLAVAGMLMGCRPAAETPKATEAEHAHNHNHGSEMPKPVSGTPFERDLFLKPGGVYTDADIQANGATLPAEKYKGISWPHDDDLKAGDKICPVTSNKADERCNWIVNSKKYEFCCVPCLDKFVKWAKEQPSRIKEPTEYIHK